MPEKEITLEEAMLMTGFGKYNIGIFFLCSFIMMGMIFETLGLSFIIPAAQCDLDLSLTQKGWLGAIPFIGIIVTSHFWGWLADTKGRKPVIIWSMAMGSFLSLVSSLCADFPLFATVRMLAALFIAGPSAVVYAYLGEFCNPMYRDRMVALCSASISIGTIILPAIAWPLYYSDFRIPIEFIGIVHRPWRLLVAMMALPYFISTFIMMEVPESPKFLACQGKTEKAMMVIKKIYAVNKGTQNDPFTNLAIKKTTMASTKTPMLRSMWEQTAPLFKPPLVKYTCIACFLQMSFFASSNGFYIWIPQILNRMLNQLESNNTGGTICQILSPKVVLLDLSNTTQPIPMETECLDIIHSGTFIRSLILSSIYTPIILVAGFVVHLLGKRNILITVTFMTGLASFVINWTTNQNLALLLLAVVQISGVCIGMMTAVVVEIFPTHLRAMAVSLTLMSGRVGSILGSSLIGYLIEVCCPVSFYLFGSLLLVGSGACLFLPKPQKNVTPRKQHRYSAVKNIFFNER